MRAPLSILVVLAALAASCGGRPAPTGGDEGRDAAPVPPAPPSDQLDVLVLVDNSNSSFGDRHLTNLRLSALLAPLAAAHPGLSVQVGLVTSDLGAGIHTPPSCTTRGGDQGLLWNRPGDAVCTAAHLTDPAARFLAFSLAAGGGASAPNFTGTVDEVFDCYRATGVGGCGFEHVLGALRAALDGCNTPAGCAQSGNAGFLRRDAYLLLVVLTDEDDCSAPADSELFDPTQLALVSPLGPLTSYRCFEFGVVCGGGDVGRDEGPRADCVPGSAAPDPRHQLVPVTDFARDFKALKASPRMVYVAVFAGPPAPVEVGLDTNRSPDLLPSCAGSDRSIFRGSADPGIRLAAFTRAFDADRARFYDACTTLADEAFAQVGQDLAAALRGD